MYRLLVRSGDFKGLVPLRSVAALGDHRLKVHEDTVEQDFCEAQEETHTRSAGHLDDCQVPP
jgi:hypothetical protein